MRGSIHIRVIGQKKAGLDESKKIPEDFKKKVLMKERLARNAKKMYCRPSLEQEKEEIHPVSNEVLMGKYSVLIMDNDT